MSPAEDRAANADRCPARPGWLALVKCPAWGTLHITMVDTVDFEGLVIRSHSGTGEAFSTSKALGVASPDKVDVLACIRRFPYPFVTEAEALAALKDWRAYEQP